ncbi:hypothetical protein F5148DRAFT_1292497 [Russula earlei]|uniref:Uncharacterized protein n=1 Tax=Russula earlei TaxID=71964 RepID=A0ACC0TTC1_9AGAM|nr:hypothetical protein F5148DRAFT_1292497 [Russula earlei]
MPKKGNRVISAYTKHNTIQLIRGGKAYFHLLEQLIDRAKYFIHLQVYIFEEDETGKLIGDALMRAASRGVKVFLVPDGYASQHLSNNFLHHLVGAGIHFRFFEPLLMSEHFYFGRRLHHKITVVDNYHCLVAGINIGDRYNDLPGQPAWLDWAAYVQGDVAAELTKPVTGKECLIRVRRNDWVKRRNQVSRSYVELLRKSSAHVTIMSSYFLPGRAIRRQLSLASRRGVKIRVILSGVSDIALAKYAERYMYRWLQKRHIELYEYTGSVLHGKMATRDHCWTTVGSYNVNDISAYASIELNLDVDNTAFAIQVQQHLDAIIANECIAVTGKVYNTYPRINRLLQYGSYVIGQIIQASGFVTDSVKNKRLPNVTIYLMGAKQTFYGVYYTLGPLDSTVSDNNGNFSFSYTAQGDCVDYGLVIGMSTYGGYTHQNNYVVDVFHPEYHFNQAYQLNNIVLKARELNYVKFNLKVLSNPYDTLNINFSTGHGELFLQYQFIGSGIDTSLLMRYVPNEAAYLRYFIYSSRLYDSAYNRQGADTFQLALKDTAVISKTFNTTYDIPIKHY